MSLTLNDEQEKALRTWWRTFKGAFEAHGPYPLNALNLHQAVAPLMQPWRVVPFELTQAIVKHELPHNPYSKRMVTLVVHDGTTETARRICDLLNESEGK